MDKLDKLIRKYLRECGCEEGEEEEENPEAVHGREHNQDEFGFETGYDDPEEVEDDLENIQNEYAGENEESEGTLEETPSIANQNTAKTLSAKAAYANYRQKNLAAAMNKYHKRINSH